MKYAICTSFSAEGFELYGKKCLETYMLYWPNSIDLWCGIEDAPTLYKIAKLRDTTPHKMGIHTFDIWYDGRLKVFLDSMPPKSDDYRYRADPFCRKVFALVVDIPDVDWWIWLDADTITDREITPWFLSQVCQREVSYLGRKDWHHSECGFVAYHVAGYGREFLDRFVGVYERGEVYEHLEWHDSYIFDRVREEFPSDWFHNLSDGVVGMHVWDGCILGEYMRHLKGPLRKKGKGHADVEAAYWSEKERV